MTRAVLTLSGLAAVTAALAALGCRKEAPAAAGPVYTPVLADLLKGLASACELRALPDGEARACKGRQALVAIELDRGRRLRALDIAVLASTGPWEAWGVIEHVLPGIIGAPAAKAVERSLRGAAAEPVVGGVRIATEVDGQRYTVKLRW